MNSKVNVGARARLTQLAAAVIAATALVACGGGGSGNSLVDKPGLALFTSATPNITVAGGSSSSFNVGGGGGGSKFVSYQATSSNAQVASVKLEGTQLTIAGLSAGSATITVTDNAGASLAIAVNVPAVQVPTLTLAAPAAVAMIPGTTAQYKVSGGVGPYTVVASNPNVAAVASGNGVISVTAANPGSSSIVVYDSVNASAKFDLTVSGAKSTPVALYTTAPEAVFVASNTTATYQIAGGVPPYTVTSNYTNVVDASVNGNVMTLTSHGTAGRATVNVRDAQGTLITVAVNVTGDAAVPLYTTAPGNIAIGVGAAPSYTIQGGTGPYTVSTSNSSVATAAVNGNTLSITGVSSGVADIVVFDSTGATSRTTATVQGGAGTVPLYTTAPQSITVAVGATPTYTMAGGAAPYTVVSSNVQVITVTQSGSTFTATGVGAGVATITVTDANGTAVNTTVTVQ